MTLRSPRITAVLAAAIAIMVATAAGSSPPTSAQTGPIVSVDGISDASNTATSVGPIDTCAAIYNNGVKDGDETGIDTIDVDVVIQGVTNISGFQGDLFYDYDPSILKVIAVDYNFLLASTNASVLDLGNTPPDTDGDFFMAAAMFSPVMVIGADGDGVLARVTFEAVGSGSSTLDLAYVKLSDANGNPIPPVNASNFYTGPVNDASVAVDDSCAGLDVCGSDPNNAASIPERIDGAFAGVDDDGDMLIDEALPTGSEGYDCDGDGYTGTAESNVYGPSTQGDQDPCGVNASPPTDPPSPIGWPSDLHPGDEVLPSVNKINVVDFTSFLAPVRYLDTNVGTNTGDHRWDLVPGKGVFGFEINIQDFTALLAGTTGYPPMLGGARAFNGPDCPWDP